MKVLCFFLLVSFACSQEIVQDKKAKAILGPWIKGKCQRPASGKCSKELTCCPSFMGVKIWTRSCHGIGCDEEKLVKEFDCIYKCNKEANWAAWISQGCTPNCGKRKDATETFRRYCIDNKGNVVNDNSCPGASSKTVKCKQDLPPCGEWGSWTAGECSKTCGKGTHKLTRECPKNSICIGDSVKYEDCQVQECGVWGDWYTGSCSASCGGGQIKSLRACSSCSACEGDAEKVEACNTAPCGSGSWSVWLKSLCSVSCGGGTRTTLRRCSTPGACEGSEEIVEECNTDVCDIDECSSNPCQNGAVCTEGVNSYECACPDGWIGTNCQEIDDCFSKPCQNDGICNDGVNSYTCACAKGWIGKDCDIKQASICGTDDGFSYDGYRYLNSTSVKRTWDEARAYCQSRGGDLAYHGLESLEFRKQTRNRMPMPSGWYHLGVRRVDGAFKWLNGTIANDSEIHWEANQGFPRPTTELFYKEADCLIWWNSEYYGIAYLVYNWPCKSSTSPNKYYTLCQYRCE